MIITLVDEAAFTMRKIATIGVLLPGGRHRSYRTQRNVQAVKRTLNTGNGNIQIISNLARRKTKRDVLFIQPSSIAQLRNVYLPSLLDRYLELAKIGPNVSLRAAELYCHIISGLLKSDIVFNQPLFGYILRKPILLQQSDNGPVTALDRTSNLKNGTTFNTVGIVEELSRENRWVRTWFAHKKNTSDSATSDVGWARLGKPLVKPLIRQLQALFILSFFFSHVKQDDAIVRSYREL